MLGFCSSMVLVERGSPTADGSLSSLGAALLNVVQILINMGNLSLETTQAALRLRQQKRMCCFHRIHCFSCSL